MQNALTYLSTLIDSGKDIKYFTWQVITLCRDALIYKVSQDTTLLTNFSSLEEIKLLSNNSKEQLTNIINTFSELENKLKWASYPNVTIETTVIKLCNPIQQISQPIATAPLTTVPTSSPTTTVTPTTPPKVQRPKFNGWNDVLNHLKKSGKVMLYGALINTTAELSDNSITITFAKENGFGKSIIEKSDNMTMLKEILTEITGKDYTIKCILQESHTTNSEDNDLENKLKNSGINVTIS